MDLIYSFLIGAALVSSAVAAFRFARPRRVLSPEGSAMEAALHAASATLPHLRRGLSRSSAAKSAPHLLRLTRAGALAITDDRELLAFVGEGRDHHHVGDHASALLGTASPSMRTSISPTACTRDSCPIDIAIVAPLLVRGERVGSLAAFYATRGAVRPADVRVVEEAATLVAAQVELAELETQGERLVRAELLALRAQISPHFVYNALAAVANSIHTKPDEARELLSDFAEFMRYAFRPEKPYVTLRDELGYVDHYLRLEQARFGERLTVRVEVAPEVLEAVVPVLSLQPLVENAVRHGIENRTRGQLVITGTDLDTEVELRVTDDGDGMAEDEARAALEGRGDGIGIANVHNRLRSAFGEGYGLEIQSSPGGGTSVRMTLPKFRPGVRAA